MTEWYLAIGLAFWFGILTSISPCPLATNIAAISFVGRKIGSVPQVLGARTPLYPGAYSDLYDPWYSAGSGLDGHTGALSFTAKVYESSDGAAADSGCNDTSETVDHSGCFRGNRRTNAEENRKNGRLRSRIAGNRFRTLFLSDFGGIVFRKSAAVGTSTETGTLLPMTYGIATGLPVLFSLFCWLFAPTKSVKYMANCQCLKCGRNGSPDVRSCWQDFTLL